MPAQANLDIPFRPLRPGVSVLNPAAGSPGTLGCFGRDAAGAVWLVSCFHVLCRLDYSVPSGPELIYQPSDQSAAHAVAQTAPNVGVAKKSMDCAAGRLLPGVTWSNDIVGLGMIAGVTQPQVGMTVLKCGATSGVTEGVIETIVNHQVIVQAPAETAGSMTVYDVTLAGDSGSVWIDATTRAAVALNAAGMQDGTGRARAIAITAILNALHLSMA